MAPRFRLRNALILVSASAIAFALTSCGEPSGKQLPERVINIGFDDDIGGCVQPLFPSDQPDLSPLSPPIFLLTGSSQQSTVGQAQARPGAAIDAEITVNAATRSVVVELVSAYSPGDVIHTEALETAGGGTIALEMLSSDDTRGRFFMRITLCGVDCDEREVKFDLLSCAEERDTPLSCGINAPYERTLIEAGQIIQVDSTCIELGSTPGIGSGTVLIQ